MSLMVYQPHPLAAHVNPHTEVAPTAAVIAPSRSSARWNSSCESEILLSSSRSFNATTSTPSRMSKEGRTVAAGPFA